MTCLVLGILIAYFFAIPIAISLHITVFHIIALTIIFYFSKLKQLKLVWLCLFSLLFILSVDIFTSHSHKEIQNYDVAEVIIENARKYEGTNYKYGGITKKGMDCSGLIHTSFKEANITLPRASYVMAKTGNWIDLKEIQEGDLLFFATNKKNRRVSHVGLVTAICDEDVEFIHSTTSEGVITSMLKEKYWYFAFIQARRVL